MIDEAAAAETMERRASRRLVARCAAGDELAWDQLLREYGGLIYSIAATYSLNAQQKKDIFIHVVEKLWEGEGRRLKAWEGRSRLSTYLAAVASRLCVDYLRSRTHRQEMRHLHIEVDECVTTRRPELQRETAHILESLMERLDDGERQVLTLFYWQRRTYRDIAALTGLKTAEVGRRLMEARWKLRAMLEKRGIKNISDILE